MGNDSVRDAFKHFLKVAAKRVIRAAFENLPDFVSVKAAEAGFSNLIKQSSKVRYIGAAFGTKFKLIAQGNYAVERNATSNRTGADEPFWAIPKLNLQNFTMLDIGANVGAYTIGAAGVGAKAVYAVEPGPLFKKLVENVALNSLEATVFPSRLGLANQPGKMRWYEDENNPGNAHLVLSPDSLSFEKTNTKLGSDFSEVDVITLDEFARRLPIQKLDLIKIDVEGMEWEVLSSGKELISKHNPIVIAETHRMASDMMKYDCLTPMFDYFYSLDYESFSFENGKFTRFIYPNFSTDTFFIPKVQGAFK